MTPSSGIVNVLDAIDAYPCGSSSLSSSLPLNNQLNNPELVVLRKPLSLKIVYKKNDAGASVVAKFRNGLVILFWVSFESCDYRENNFIITT